MTAVVAIVLIAHGLFHLLGFAVAFGFAELPQLTGTHLTAFRIALADCRVAPWVLRDRYSSCRDGGGR